MTLQELFDARQSHIVVVAEVPLVSKESGQVVTEYFSTESFTVRKSHPTAPGRHYSPRLVYPVIPWTRHRDTADGGTSAADTTSLQIVDLDNAHSNLDGFVLEGRVTLRIGSPGLDLLDWVEIKMGAKNLRKQDVSWFVDLESLDAVFDDPFPRRALRGLGGCVQLGKGESVTVQRTNALEPSNAEVPGSSSRLAVEYIVWVEGVEQFKFVSKGGKGNGGEWTFTHIQAGDIKFGARDTGGAWHEIQAPLPHGKPVRVRGQLDGGVLALYLDGAIAASVPFAASLAASAHNFALGPGPGIGKLLLDDLRLWVDDLPSITEFDRWGVGELPLEHHERCAFYFRFNEGFGVEAFDDSFHRHRAVLPSESVWGSMGEGPIGQNNLRPEGAGTVVRVPGVYLSELVLQVHDGEIRGAGPVDEGGAWLLPKRRWERLDIGVQPGTSPDEITANIWTVGEHDFGGLVAGQWVRVTSTVPGSEQSVLCEVARPSQPLSIDVLPIEPLLLVFPGDFVTVETASYEVESDNIRFAGSVLIGEDFRIQPPGSTFSVFGSALNDGDLTVVGMTETTITVEEVLDNESAGASVKLTWEEIWDYTVQGDMGTITLRSPPTNPLAIDFRGPVAAGDTRARLMQYVAERHGVTDFDQKSIDLFELADRHPAGYWLGPDDEPTGRALLDLLAGVDSWGFTFGGLFELARREKPTTPALAMDYRRHCYNLGRSGSPEASSKQEVRWGQNYVVLSEDHVVGEADDTRASWGLDPWRTAIAPTYPPTDLLPGAEPGPSIESPYYSEVGAYELAERVYSQERLGTQVWEGATTFRALLVAARRDAVLITSDDHAALGTEGKIMLILRMEVNTETMQILITLWRPNDA